ncbi:hypothetical protein [Bacteroides sp. 519]|uniref:hypothetical protein n=1 Tax=Bacteroides sp. 519 TaxID=2302937 RepID=UPI0013D0474F|nr:hypothetical protein [Bacteroides sp. 519]
MREKNPSTNQQQELNLILREQLKKTVHLRLFRNTNQEMGEYIGYKLNSNNSLNNIPPFTARCIFRELCRETQKQIAPDLDLEECLAEYEKASNCYERYMKGRERMHQEENIHELLKYAYLDDYKLPAKKAFLQKVGSAIWEQEIYMPILLLLILKVLPVYTSKKGDVKDAVNDFRCVYLFLKRFTMQSSVFEELPILERFDKQVRENIYCSRLYLIYITAVTLNTFSNYANPQELYSLNTSVNNNKIILDVDDAIWVEPGMLSTPSVFMKFEYLNTNDYFLYRYVVNIEKKELVYVRYEATFLNDNLEELILFVNTFNSIIPIIEGKPFPDNSLIFFACSIDNWKFPQTMELHPLSFNKTDFTVKKLIRLTEEDKIAQITKCFEGGYTIRNKYPESDYTLMLYPLAITWDSIYIKDEAESTDQEPVYYCIPKSLNCGLEDITTKDAVGILTTNGRKYIEVVPLLLFLDITDETMCKKNGVLLTNKISF